MFFFVVVSKVHWNENDFERENSRRGQWETVSVSGTVALCFHSLLKFERTEKLSSYSIFLPVGSWGRPTLFKLPWLWIKKMRRWLVLLYCPLTFLAYKRSFACTLSNPIPFFCFLVAGSHRRGRHGRCHRGRCQQSPRRCQDTAQHPRGRGHRSWPGSRHVASLGRYLSATGPRWVRARLASARHLPDAVDGHLLVHVRTIQTYTPPAGRTCCGWQSKRVMLEWGSPSRIIKIFRKKLLAYHKTRASHFWYS